MIVLLSYSISSLGSKCPSISSTGVVDSNDSVLIAYDDLRIANSKMIELEYEKEKNRLLKTAIVLDSILIKNQDQVIDEAQQGKRKAIQQRNIAAATAGAGILGLILVLLFK